MTPSTDELALFERLIRIETKLDVANTFQVDHEGRIRALEMDNTPGGHVDHESRLRLLEGRIWRAGGFAAAVGLAASYFVPQLAK